MIATYNLFRDSLDKEMIPAVPQRIGKLKLPSRNNLLKIQLQYFIEIVNARPNQDTYHNFELLTACFYREDWSKPFNDDELITNATWLNSQPLMYNLYGVILMQELFNLLRSTYPILYSKEQDAEDEEDGRKLYDMLNGLAKDDPTKWDDARNLTLETAFTYLEEKKLDYEKKRLNLHNTK